MGALGWKMGYGEVTSGLNVRSPPDSLRTGCPVFFFSSVCLRNIQHEHGSLVLNARQWLCESHRLEVSTGKWCHQATWFFYASLCWKHRSEIKLVSPFPNQVRLFQECWASRIRGWKSLHIPRYLQIRNFLLKVWPDSSELKRRIILEQSKIPLMVSIRKPNKRSVFSSSGRAGCNIFFLCSWGFVLSAFT